jgi:uncharacterized delta-60 repeat protein/prepilin-type N-terminal cleavage/methylation domain-containing protein
MQRARREPKGFTLLEILLVIAAIGVLAAIVLIAINPTRQLAQVRNAERRSEINTIYKAIEQYLINTGSYPTGITTVLQDICINGNTTNCVNLGVLVPDYMAAIPIDPTGIAYRVAINLNNSRISVISTSAELSQDISINKNTSGTLDLSLNLPNTVNNIVFQSDGKMLTGASDTSTPRVRRYNSDFSIDTGFNEGALSSNSASKILLQTNGKILVSGSFTSYNGVSTNRIIRLNSDGIRDTTFNIGTGFDNDVRTLTQQADGKILVGGGFGAYQGVAAIGIIRLNSDGSRDTTFNTVTSFGDVYTLALQSDGKILVGGWFTIYNGVSANRIIRLNSDGSRDTTFNIGTGFNFYGMSFGGVHSIRIQSDGKILAGGYFNAYQGVESNYIIRLNSDGSRDTTFNIGTGFDTPADVLALQSDGKILVGGRFASYNGVSANRIIRLNSDGSRDTTFDIGTGFNRDTSDIFQQSDGKILVGGIYVGFGPTYKGASIGRWVRLNN